jgi:hypothetical protein
MGNIKMLSTHKIYTALKGGEFTDGQAEILTECFEKYEKNIKETPNDYATKSDIEKLEDKIKWIDQKLDIQRSELTKAIDRVSHYMLAGFSLIFASIGYLIFKI